MTLNLGKGVTLSCPRCQARWVETDPVALAGWQAGYGVRCPDCSTAVNVARRQNPEGWRQGTR